MSAPVQLVKPSVAPMTSPPPVAVPAIDDPAAQRRRSQRRRRVLVQVLRVVTAVVWIGSWELTTRIGLVDKFFFGQPSGVFEQLRIWVTEGTALGPLWLQVAATMEETILGFIVGSVTGVVVGVLLGRNRLLADVMSPYIKAANSIPRVVLGALFAISLGLDIRSKIATNRFKPRTFQTVGRPARLPRNPTAIKIGIHEDVAFVASTDLVAPPVSACRDRHSFTFTRDIRFRFRHRHRPNHVVVRTEIRHRRVTTPTGTSPQPAVSTKSAR